MDISVVIPILDEWPSILYTVHSILLQMKERNVDYEILIVDNGGDDRVKRWVENPDIPKNVRLIPFTDVRSYQLCTHIGVENARGKYVLFLDGHCLISRGFIERVVELLDEGWTCGVHSPVSYGGTYGAGMPWYQMEIDIFYHDGKFGERWSFEKLSDEPYPVAVSSFCGFTTKKSSFLKVAGPNKAVQNVREWTQPCGTFIQLKYWMFDQPIVVDPELLTVHLDVRSKTTKAETVFRNNLICYYVLGGEEYARTYLRKDEQALSEVISAVREERDFVVKNQRRSLFDLPRFFDKNGVFWKTPARGS